MASVYLAEQVSLKRRVMNELRSARLAADPTFITRLLRGLRIASRQSQSVFLVRHLRSESAWHIA